MPAETTEAALAGKVPPGVYQKPWTELPETDDAVDRLPVYGGILGQVPGTMILVGIFLAAFITYYFANWKLLSFIWQVG
jgi:hypothetical protein